MFKKIKKKKKYEEVLDQIKHLLITRKIKVGQRLPNEMELSEMMNISRSSLREALKILSIIGIIESKAGEGTIIKQAQPENLQIIMSLVAISKGLDTNELFEVRIILENAAANLAAKRRSEENLHEIHKILVEMDKHYLNQDTEAQIYHDFLFHQAIVNASKNRMLVTLTEIIADLLGEQIETTRRELESSKQVLNRFQEEHWAI